MTSIIRSAVKYIQLKATPNAVYSPCINHSLNLFISKSSNVLAIKNTVDVIKKMVKFFNMSRKRNNVQKLVFRNQKHLMRFVKRGELKDYILAF